MLRRLMSTLLLSGAALATTAHAADLPAYPFLHVGARGFTVAPPDIGKIDFEIVAAHADAAEALNIVEARIATIRASLEQAGVPLEDLGVHDIRTAMLKDSATYELRCGVVITVRELSKWKAAVAPLLPMPNLDGFVTAFDITDRDKVEASLMTDALRQARAKADAMAASLGRKVAGVGGVSTGSLKNLSRAMDFAPTDYFNSGRDTRSAPGDLIVVNAVKLAQPVDVIFRLK